MRPDLARTRSYFEKLGLSGADADAHVDSGFVYFEEPGIVIDRYYGGALLSVDSRTRFAGYGFDLPPSACSRVRMTSAQSLCDLREIVDRHADVNGKRLLFRGQTRHYALERPIANPFLAIPGLGEVSLVPSLWRRMLAARKDRFPPFIQPSLLDWSHILYSTFDLEDSRRRHRRLHEKGEYIFTMSEMEDCSDPVVVEFGKHRMDLSMGLDYNLADSLATLLQHYGLHSPVLDLTSSVDVAIFFATHEFHRSSALCDYRFVVGTTSREFVVYVFREDSEMCSDVCDEAVLRRAGPLRPKRQNCVIARSGEFAVNLPADFLEIVIRLDFDLAEDLGPPTQELFPGASEDGFLRALKSHSNAQAYLTEFV